MLGILVRTTVALSILLPRVAPAADLEKPYRNNANQLTSLGDALFRQSRFEEAEAAYTQALELDHESVGGHLGLGKIATLLSDHTRAARHYSAAYQTEPRNPEAILAFSTVVTDREARRILLRNYLALSSKGSGKSNEVAAQLRIEERLGSRTAGTLVSPVRHYQIPLTSLRTEGLLLRVHINGGRELKLILDTGATGVVLNASVREPRLEFVTAAALAGFGSSAPAHARVALAESFTVGDLNIANLLLEVSDTDLTKDADGLIGLDVFQDFVIRLDPRGHKLDLTPHDPAAECQDCTRAYRLGHLLLVRAKVNGSGEGYFILDTGSPFTLISRKLMPKAGRSVLMEGVQGQQELAVPGTPVTLQLGDRHLWGFEYATLDTDAISASNGTAIAGAIGYSLLRDLSLTVDYHDGLVKLGKPGRP
jgi:tetratricopeptide (TPR) repeat protein